MELVAGQSVYLSFCGFAGYDRAPEGHVYRAAIVDPEHRVCKTEHGAVRVIEEFEGIHSSAADAWRACAAELDVKAAAVLAEAAKCRARASAVGQIVSVPSQGATV